MNIENRQKPLVIIVAVVLVLLVGDSFIRKPLMESWTNRSKRIADLKKEVDMDNRLIERRTSILARWNKMQTNALPADKSAAETKVLNALETWTRESDIRIERRQPQWRDEEDSTMLEFYIDATGGITSVRSFLFALERDLPKLALKIEQLDVSRRDNNGQQIALTLQLTGLVIGTPVNSPR
jgi:hypothetical protein